MRRDRWLTFARVCPRGPAAARRSGKQKRPPASTRSGTEGATSLGSPFRLTPCRVDGVPRRETAREQQQRRSSRILCPFVTQQSRMRRPHPDAEAQVWCLMAHTRVGVSLQAWQRMIFIGIDAAVTNLVQQFARAGWLRCCRGSLRVTGR